MNLNIRIEKKQLQLATTLISCIPLIIGLMGLLAIASPHFSFLSPYLTRHLSYAGKFISYETNLTMSTIFWLILTVIGFYTVPNIQQKKVEFKLVWIMVLLSSISKLVAITYTSLPPFPGMLIFLLGIVGSLGLMLAYEKMEKTHQF